MPFHPSIFPQGVTATSSVDEVRTALTKVFSDELERDSSTIADDGALPEGCEPGEALEEDVATEAEDVVHRNAEDDGRQLALEFIYGLGAPLEEGDEDLFTYETDDKGEAAEELEGEVVEEEDEEISAAELNEPQATPAFTELVRTTGVGPNEQRFHVVYGEYAGLATLIEIRLSVAGLCPAHLKASGTCGPCSRASTARFIKATPVSGFRPGAACKPVGPFLRSSSSVTSPNAMAWMQ
ncbi:hypothetical protein HDU87_000573 [Geranomyces variabilis]|uniref:Uncharacterized protein n=1 Tax=Geranomyces variabilis TaxID=109894 RepID=A0AAD5XNU3_9FUNG|nr:hypothetical protein HDU87_000573 [Geranomyces variabilis]